MAVRWGFLGAGYIARTALGPAVHAASGAVLQSAAARDPIRAAALGPAGRSYSVYEDVLADPHVDAIYISLTNEMHAHWSIAAMEAGKHVLCEKPLAMTAAEVDAMADAAAATGRVLVEASWYRWHPRTRRAIELLSSGAIGTVRHVTAGFTFDGQLVGNYRLEPSRGGGALYDVGCYAISAALWAFGGRPVRSVSARSDVGPSGVDLATDAILSFDDGDAEIRGGISEPPAQWLVISGDAGEIEARGRSFTAWAGDETMLLVSDGATTHGEEFAAVDAYQLMVEEVSSVIAGGDGWVLPLAESRATAAVIDACRTSASCGGEPVELATG